MLNDSTDKTIATQELHNGLDEALKQREKMIKTLNEMAIIFLSQSKGTFVDTITTGVNMIIDVVQMDRFSIWRNFVKPDGLYTSQVYYWDKKTGGSTGQAETDIAYAKLAARWKDLLATGEFINGPVRLLSEAGILESFGVVSVFITPIFIDNSFWGLVIFEDRSKERIFTENETHILHSAALMMSNTVNRHEESVKIREADERTLLMFNASPLGCKLWDKDLNLVECNEEVLHLFDLQTKQDFLDRFFELSPEYQPCGRLTKEKASELINKAFEEGFCRFEWMHRKLNGEPIPAEITLVRVKHKEDYVVAGYIRDLREYKQMMNKIEKRDNLLNTMNQVANVLLSTEDKENTIAPIMAGMELLGLAVDLDRVHIWQNEMIDGALQFVHKHEWLSEIGKQKASIPIGLHIPYSEKTEWESKFLRGEYINSPLSKLPESDQDLLSHYDIQSIVIIPLFLQDRLWGVFSLDDCLKERTFSEEEIDILRSGGLLIANAFLRNDMTQNVHSTAARLEAVISNYSGIIWSVDRNNVITLFNGQYLKEIGITPSFIEGKNLDIAGQKNRHLDIIENVERTFLKGSQDWLSEIDGKVYRVHTTPIFDENGMATDVVGSIDDISDLIWLQTELKSAMKEAQIANTAKSKFLATMSHEIRTPMNTILGITEIQLQNDKLESGISEAFGMIYNSGDLLLGIINDILDMSKIEAGKLELIVSKYELASLINDTMQLNMMRIGSKQIKFELYVDENMPLEFFGDELRIKQILNNLLSNAFKYTERGVVKLSVFVESEPDKDAPDKEEKEEKKEKKETDLTLVFIVSDTGQGMTEDQVNKLFDEFSRFNQEINATTEGTGLGMSIAKNLIDMMNGKILVESEAGKGTTFTLRLPQKSAGQKVIGKELVENLQQFRMNSKALMKRTQISREPMPYGRVLVVDDTETNIYVAKGILTPYDLSVDSAKSGFEAIEKIKSGNVYDIVFMDHFMPKMDGIEATKIIRDLGYTGSIVALTANAVVGQSEMFLKNGFDDFISKPIDIRQMNIVLNKLIRDKQPTEIVEAARRQQKSSPDKLDRKVQPSLNPELAEIFTRDASRVITILEAICKKQNALNDEDMQMYIINTHGMKSPLANIGESELSDFAAKLEQAGRDKDIALISAETPMFLNELRDVIEKIKPKEEDKGSETVDEDKEYLREKLQAIQSACAAYNKKAAKDAMTELRQKTWSHQTKELLGTISEHLLHSDFDEAASILEKTIETM